jgi:signal transduction histidine kinase
VTVPDEDERITRLAHDLRTPLTIVSGFAELLARRGEELDPEQRADFIARIDAAAREMRVILDTERDERLARG